MQINKKFVEIWTTDDNMKKFETAFTHPSYDDNKEDKDKVNSKENNYEFY